MKRFTIVLAALAMMISTAAFAAEDGAALYKAKCAACHGAAAEGKGPAPAAGASSRAPSHRPPPHVGSAMNQAACR